MSRPIWGQVFQVPNRFFFSVTKLLREGLVQGSWRGTLPGRDRLADAGIVWRRSREVLAWFSWQVGKSVRASLEIIPKISSVLFVRIDNRGNTPL